MKTNILLLTDCFADLAGGAEKQIYELAGRLDKNKYNVFVVSLDCWGQAPREVIELTGSRLDIFRVVRIYGISGLIQGFRFFKFLRQHQIKILLTYHFSSDMWGTFWGHLAGVPMIISNRRDMGFWRNGWHVRAYRLMNHWVNKIIVVSQSIKQMIIETEGVKPETIEVIYNGVTIVPETRRASLDIKPGEQVIMHVANLKPVKGHQYLLEAFAQVLKTFPQAKLVLIGKDEFNGRIEQLAESLSIQDKMLFLGKRDDIAQLLPLADICVLPSLSEGMSNSILEYMAAAKPVIASRVGGNPELVKDGFNGLLVDSQNTEELKEALLKLLGDQQKRALMGQHGLSRVENEFSMENMVRHYDELLQKSKTIKVLHLVSSGGLFGAERVILNLSSRSQAAECTVGAIYNHHNPHLELIEEAKRLGVACVTFESRGRLDLRTISEVKNFLKTNNIDILHTHNYKSDIIGFWASRWAGKKWMATNHVWHSTDNKLKFYEAIDACVLKGAHMVVSVSEEIRQGLLKLGFKKERLQVIDNGIPVENFGQKFPVDQTRQSLKITPDDCAVLIVGRLAPEKGHEIFLQAAQRVIQKTRSVKFIMVGDGPLKASLEQQVKDLGLSAHVVFAGLRQDMPAVYASCNILVNSSFIEGLPMTILEAMASRLAIIATKVGAVREVIQDGHNGLLLEPGHPEDLARAMLELIVDDHKRESLGQEAYKDVCARFSDARMAHQYNQIYAHL